MCIRDRGLSFRYTQVDPKAVETRLLNHDDWNDLPRADMHLVLELREPRPQSSDIAAANSMLRHLFSAARRQRCNQPGRSTEFQRDENRAKISADGGWRLGSVSDNLHGRLQSGWVSNLTLPELRSLSTPHGISSHRPRARPHGLVDRHRGRRYRAVCR